MSNRIAEPALERRKQILLEIIPWDGKLIPNREARERFDQELRNEFGYQMTADDYWETRNSLVEDGELRTGRGRGGMVARTPPADTAVSEDPKSSSSATGVVDEEADRLAERELYDDFHNTIRESFARDRQLDDFVSEITAFQGRRKTGGKWTRPDVTLVAVNTYQFLPGKRVEVFTFELKPKGGASIEGVFETAAHSLFAHKSFLAIHFGEDDDWTEELERIERECERFRVGFLLFGSPSDWDTFEVRVEPERHSPDHADIDDFIKTQLSEQNQERLRKLIR